eukprot:3682670-Amphidinium_carterae.1
MPFNTELLKLSKRHHLVTLGAIKKDASLGRKIKGLIQGAGLTIPANLLTAAPKACNLRKQSDGPSLTRITYCILGKLKVEHLSKVGRPDPNKFNRFEELGEVNKLEFSHAPSVSTPSFTSKTMLDNACNGAGTASTRIVSDDAPKPERARLPELAPSFKFNLG